MIRIGITMGDPAGIGPEIVIKAARANSLSSVEHLLIGSRSVMRAAAEAQGVSSIDEAMLNGMEDIGHTDDAEMIQPGRVASRCGRLAYKSIERAVALAMAGEIDAIVTAPINKEALHSAGFDYPGHTEILKDLTRSADTCMMLAHGDFRVSHVTTHIALEDVASRVTAPRVQRVIELTHAALVNMGVASPRVAVCALNPHAGEGGLFGLQDVEILTPVVEAFQSRGLKVFGPYPGDTVFIRARGGEFDAVIAMYHDQGHIPIKLLGFSVDRASGKWTSVSGVNITLGCPIIRTSVDHGTAFDIAGKGVANAQSMTDAIAMAVQLAGNRPRGEVVNLTREMGEIHGRAV
jgi:4-hydroxythreonine-4-phosphate dehydrogenase